MKVTALAGGIGAGKFLRGLSRVVAPEDVTVVINTGDDFVVHGLHVAPDIDSVTYWLSGEADLERGWGRRGETFRATEELNAFGAEGAWFNLGDLDLATHIYRSARMARGASLSEVTGAVASHFGLTETLLPMSDRTVTTRLDVVDAEARELDLHLQEYWVKRHAADRVLAIRYVGATDASPAPGVLASISNADTIVICPSNPVASIAPILAVPGIREVLAQRRDRVVGVSPIVGGAPVRGMADKLMPAVGAEVSARGAARLYEGLLGAWVIDEVDASSAPEIRDESGATVAVTDTMMIDDDRAASLALAALEALP